MQTGQHKNTLPIGCKIHWYEVEKTLGQGGFGITYLALDTNLDQQVAIKEYFPAEIVVRDQSGSIEARSDEDAGQFEWGLKRFLDEARTLAKFDHPNIVRVYSVFEANNTAYLVMRFEEGESLRELIKRKRHFSEKELLDIALPVLDGLNTIHKTGFIHRDIQPANIYIREDGEPVLLDFGAARHTLGETRTMTILVSPGYAPIEQYYSEAAQQGPWTDIYGMGATLYRAIAGVKPIDAIERSRGMLGSTRDVLVPANVAGQGRYSEKFLEAIDHALQFNEKERPQTAVAFIRELDSEIQEVTTANPTISQPLPSRQEKGKASMEHAQSQNNTQPADGKTGQKSYLVPALIAAVFVLGISAGVILPGILKENNEPAPVPAETVAQNPGVSVPGPATAEIALPATAGPSTAAASTAEEPVSLPAGRQTVVAPAAETGTGTAGIAETANENINKEAAEKAELQVQLAEEARRIAALKEELSGLQAAREEEQRRLRKLEEERKAKEILAKEKEAESIAAALENTASSQQIKSTLEAKEAVIVDPLKPVDDAVLAGDHTQAVKLLKPLAARGNADAQYRLGKYYHEGRGVLANNNIALDLMRKAAWQGQTDAQVALANMYLNGINGIKDPFLAYTWFLVAERNGLYKLAAIRNKTEANLQSEQLAQAAALANELVLKNK